MTVEPFLIFATKESIRQVGLLGLSDFGWVALGAVALGVLAIYLRHSSSEQIDRSTDIIIGDGRIFRVSLRDKSAKPKPKSKRKPKPKSEEPPKGS
jgi:hypothetical protein